MINYSGQSYQAREVNLMYRVYAWMCFALALTAITAYVLSNNIAFMTAITQSSAPMIVLFVAQLALVVVLSMFLSRMNFITALVLFTLYAVSMGVTLSVIFLVFTQSSIFATFLVTSGMFGAMSIYGYFTKADLSSMGSYLFMALIGLILGGLVNMWFKSPGFQYMLSALGVLVFTLLTAYDVQKIKQMSESAFEDRDSMAKASIMGALILYLDFVNLFLYLLQFMGKRKD